MERKDLIDFEREVIEGYKKGSTYGPVHLSGGNEDELLWIFKQIREDDWVFTNHRSHYHALLKSKDRKWLLKRILDGYSSHINSSKYRIFSSSIVGGCIPIALGTSLALKLKKSASRVWCFIGDQAAEMGALWEAIKYARNFGLPVFFVVENNHIGSNMPTEEVWGKQTPIDDPQVINYEYEFNKPHYGIGEWVIFKKRKGRRGFKSMGGMYGY